MGKSEDDGEDLFLFAHDTSFYDHEIAPTLRKLARAHKNGSYKHADAIKTFEALMIDADVRYQKEIRPRRFSPVAIREAAANWVDNLESELAHESRRG